MEPMNWKRRALPLLGAALLAGCAADDQTIVTPATPPQGQGLFDRYVAMGESNTAGFQSLGINDSTQHQSYAVLLARMAGVPVDTAFFFVPRLEMPGCPPPLTGPQPLTDARVGGGNSDQTCALRVDRPVPAVSNVAVPGSRIEDWVDNALADSRSNPLTTLFLGGRTQLQAMEDARPTLVSVFPEGNELLQPVLAGRPELATSRSVFEAALDRVVGAIQDAGARAVLIGTIDVPRVSPGTQPGAYYFLLQAAGQSPKPVSPTCAPGTPGGASLVAFSVLSDPAVSTVGCGPDDPGVLSPAEIAEVDAIVAGYNAAVKARADANGWVYVDPNEVLAPLVADPAKFRKCQGLATAATPLQFQEAVIATCPGPQAPNFWGGYVSYDPVHVNALTQQAFANALATRINQTYGTSIPVGS